MTFSFYQAKVSGRWVLGLRFPGASPMDAIRLAQRYFDGIVTEVQACT